MFPLPLRSHARGSTSLILSSTGSRLIPQRNQGEENHKYAKVRACLMLRGFTLSRRDSRGRSRANNVLCSVEKCASRIFPHYTIHQASAAGASERDGKQTDSKK